MLWLFRRRHRWFAAFKKRFEQILLIWRVDQSHGGDHMLSLDAAPKAASWPRLVLTLPASYGYS